MPYWISQIEKDTVTFKITYYNSKLEEEILYQATFLCYVIVLVQNNV